MIDRRILKGPALPAPGLVAAELREGTGIEAPGTRNNTATPFITAQNVEVGPVKYNQASNHLRVLGDRLQGRRPPLKLPTKLMTGAGPLDRPVARHIVPPSPKNYNQSRAALLKTAAKSIPRLRDPNALANIYRALPAPTLANRVASLRSIPAAAREETDAAALIQRIEAVIKATGEVGAVDPAVAGDVATIAAEAARLGDAIEEARRDGVIPASLIARVAALEEGLGGLLRRRVGLDRKPPTMADLRKVAREQLVEYRRIAADTIAGIDLPGNLAPIAAALAALAASAVPPAAAPAAAAAAAGGVAAGGVVAGAQLLADLSAFIAASDANAAGAAGASAAADAAAAALAAATASGATSAAEVVALQGAVATAVAERDAAQANADAQQRLFADTVAVIERAVDQPEADVRKMFLAERKRVTTIHTMGYAKADGKEKDARAAAIAAEGGKKEFAKKYKTQGEKDARVKQELDEMRDAALAEVDAEKDRYMDSLAAARAILATL